MSPARNLIVTIHVDSRPFRRGMRRVVWHMRWFRLKRWLHG